MGHQQNVLLAVGTAHFDQFVTLVQGQGADTGLARRIQHIQLQALHRTHTGDHHKETLVKLADGQTRRHFLACLQRQDIDDIGALGGTACLGDQITLLAVNLTGIGKEQNVIVGRSGKHSGDHVLVAGGHSLHALTAAALGRILAGRCALDITVSGHGVDALFLLDKIFNVDLILHFLDLGAALIAVLVADLQQFVLQHAAQQFLVAQQFQIVSDALFQLIILILQLLAVQTLQCLKTHIQNSLCLHIVQRKALHQCFLRIVVTGANDTDNFINIILCDQQTFQQMGALTRLTQIVLGAAGQHFHLECQILVDDLAQRQDFRLLLVIHQSQQNDAEAALQRCLFKEMVQHHLRISILLQLDNDAHTDTVGLVTQVGNTLQPLFAHLFGDLAHQFAFIHLIGQLRHDDTGAVCAELLKLRAGADNHLAAAGGIGGADTAAAHNDTAGGEIGAGNMLHQLTHSDLGVFQYRHAGVDHFRQVVGRNIGGHTNGDTVRAVDQQIGEAAGQHTGLFLGFIEVGIPIDSFLVDVPQHFAGDLGKTSLGITVSSGGVAVD